MLTARNPRGVTVYAPEVEKDAAPFSCAGCGSEVILKKGAKVIHHFAHVPDSLCNLRGESVEHMTAKWQIYQALKYHPRVNRAEVEHALGPETRADVMFRKDGTQVVAVEIQRSRLDSETILKRMSHYTAKGIAVLWLIFPFQLKRKYYDADTYFEHVTPQRWQRYIQSLYFGRLYEWSHGWGLEVYRSHLTGSWHRRQSGLMTGESVNIVEDFKPQMRTDPALRLYLDTLPKWWATRTKEENANLFTTGGR